MAGVRQGVETPKAVERGTQFDRFYRANYAWAVRVARKAVLVLRYYADLSEADIAMALDCRTGTVKSLASRGLAQLRKTIEP